MLQIVVYSVLARQARKSVYLLWIGLLAVVGLGSMADTFDELLTDRARRGHDRARRTRGDQPA